jgi:hypothetical protein
VASELTLRIFSSFVQVIASELYFRTKRTVAIQFLPEARVFAYDDPAIKSLVLTRPSSTKIELNAFQRPHIKLVDTVLSDIPDDQKKLVKEQEDKIEKLDSALKHMKNALDATNRELTDQTEQLTEINKKADKATKRMNSNAHAATKHT